MAKMLDKIRRFAELFRAQGENVTFTMLEVGGVPLGEQAEPFHALLEIFPGSRIIAFELDEALCRELNEKALPGLEYFPIALGRAEETRTLYETRHPMCCSLYEPNEPLLSLYQNMEVAYLKARHEVPTASLDGFAAAHDIGPVDFIKIDIQGAELDVFQGGSNVLRDVVAMVCEVEFVYHYVGQPLFGDVSAHLHKEGMMFHKFLGMAGRALKPVVMNNNPNFASQQIWSDAVFIRDVLRIGDLAPQQLLKLGVLAYLYGSADLTYYCFQAYDALKGSDLRTAVILD